VRNLGRSAVVKECCSAESKPLVSVVVPAYNAGGTLAECLESIIGQTYERIEVVVVDDGSNDDTRAVAQALADADSRVHVVSQPNQGCPTACNAGFDLSRGSWLIRFDADDLMSDTYVADMLNLAQRYPGYSAYASNGFFFGSGESKPIHRIRKQPHVVDVHVVLSAGPALPCNALFCRDYLELTGGFDPALRHTEDFDFWLRGALLGAVFLFDYQPRWYYRRHGQGKSSDARAETVTKAAILDAASAQVPAVSAALLIDLERARRKAGADVIRRDLEYALVQPHSPVAPRRRFLSSYFAYEKPWGFWLALPLIVADPRLYGWIVSRRRYTPSSRR